MTTFIVPANRDKYDSITAFNALNTVHWVQHSNKSVSVGDIIYIYESKPTQAIILKTKVVSRDVYEYHIDDSKYSESEVDFSVKADKVAYKPCNISFEAAAAVPLAAMTALQMLRQLQVGPGTKVLIQAGAGGVGIFAIQLAKIMGAYVATTASVQNTDFVKSLGADEVIDYHTTNITDVLHDYDTVFDMVSAIDEGMAILKPTGHLVTISGRPTEAQASGTQTVEAGWLQPTGTDLAYLGKLIVNDQLQIILDNEYPLTTDGIRASHQRSESHHARGKIVIKVRD